MTKLYQLSMYKFLGGIEDPKDLKVSPLEAYYKNSLGSTIYVYYSPYSGVLTKNLDTKVTEKFEALEGITYLDAIEDYSGEMVLLYKTKLTTIIKMYSIAELQYNTYNLSIKCDKAFLVKFDSDIFCIYLNNIDNKIYHLKASENFSKPVLLHNSTFNKQAINSVGLNAFYDRPSVYLTVVDNTLLKDYQKHPILTDRSFVEVLTNHRLFEKESK